MTDILRDEAVDQQAFYEFAHQMNVSGRCMKIQCTHYDHDEGPKISNQHCRACFRQWTKR